MGCNSQTWGSILTHDHYQGGNYLFPMLKAEKVFDLSFKGFEDVKASYLKWPLSVIRIQSKDKERLLALAVYILDQWRGYSDEESFIYAETDGVPHNTISPICHKIGDEFAFDLALRNNITTKDYPLGVYHPHEELWNIKKENIGLIEVMGLAVLPSRLENELQVVKDALLTKKVLLADEVTKKHASWVSSFIGKYPTLDQSTIDEIFDQEVGLTFKKVLECAGVYKQDEKGFAGLRRFISYCNR